jgi:hypothetical protein
VRGIVLGSETYPTRHARGDVSKELDQVVPIAFVSERKTGLQWAIVAASPVAERIANTWDSKTPKW